MKNNQKISLVRLGHMFILAYVLVFFIGVFQCLANDDCTRTYPNPVIRYDHKDAQGSIYIPVVNWADYANEMFRPAPDLPPCGANNNSSRTWVEIYNADTNTRVYGFCAFNSNNNLTQIWFKPDTGHKQVYIILNDRACKKSYKSNIITWESQDDCTRTYPNPVIRYDHKDAEGRIYIPVDNWADYANEMFRPAPDLPPCGLNNNSSRTWVDIYNADTNARVYGFCAFNSNNNLTQIWFKPDASHKQVYIILNDRACKKNYKSNIIKWESQDDCTKTYPNPVIKFDHKDAEGRIYIPVDNWADYANEMFRPAPDLPPCGANNNSSRTWVDIYNANTNAKIYGFCALNSNNSLTQIWFTPESLQKQVYIIINDRACKKSYKSNIISWSLLRMPQKLPKSIHKIRS
ncbi:MAG TPA: hypothetical protein VK469_13585 [Candidatus Kapabacteria bacterium]|nr:hypothetical protein [Candidatus Kapabacteria bacterium]